MAEMFLMQCSFPFIVLLISPGSDSLLLKTLNYFILTRELRPICVMARKAEAEVLSSLRVGALIF